MSPSWMCATKKQRPPQWCGQTKIWWGKLTDDDLEKVGGKFDKLIGLLQEKYGYTQQQAIDEYRKRTK